MKIDNTTKAILGLTLFVIVGASILIPIAHAQAVCYDQFIFAWHTLNPVLECLDGSISSPPTALNDLTDVIIVSPTARDYLIYNGTHWLDLTPLLNDNTDVVLSGLANANIIIYNGTHWLNRVVSGDISISNTGVVDISDNAVENSEIATHTSTKITITNKAQLNSAIAYEDESNTFSELQTINDSVLVQQNLNFTGGGSKLGFFSGEFIWEEGANILALRNEANNAYVDLKLDDITVDSKIHTDNYDLFEGSAQGATSMILQRIGGNNFALLVIAPSGLEDLSRLRIFATSDVVTNSEILDIGYDGSSTYIINSIKAGTGTTRPIALQIDSNDIVKLTTDIGVETKFNSKAGDPSGADIASGFCETWKNTSTGVVKYWCNDGGTYKGIALA